LFAHSRANRLRGTWSTRATRLSNSVDAVAFGNLTVKVFGEFPRLGLAG
jgi:hypothetical protein